MNSKLFQEIKEKHGRHASWAIWPLSDLSDYEKISERIKPNIVMAALNPSGDIESDFRNFHIPEGPSTMHPTTKSNTEKLIHAFKGSKFDGAYMTDIIKADTIKGLNLSNSTEVIRYLKDHPEVEAENIERFKEELNFIGSKEPLIIAFGGDAFKILNRNRKKLEGFKLIKATHYAIRGDKITYKEEVWKMIKFQLSFQAPTFSNLSSNQPIGGIQ